MSTLLLAGATGLVGRHALGLALADPRISRVVAVTRRPLPASVRLLNPVVADFEELPVDADWWQADAVVCALGTTIRDAGSPRAFRTVDFDHVLSIARLARAHGARAFALNSSLGADPASRNFYLRTKGQIEQALDSCGYPSLSIVRPSLIGGERERPRRWERLGVRLGTALAPLLPRRYRVVPAAAVARALLEGALAAAPGLRVLESDQL